MSNDNNTSPDGPGLVLTSPLSGIPAGERLLTVPDVADLLGVIVTRVMDELNRHRLIAVDVDGVRHIPARFFTDNAEINKFVPGVIALLADGGWEDAEILDFLFTDDESLPGRPVDALHGGHAPRPGHGHQLIPPLCPLLCPPGAGRSAPATTSPGPRG